MGLVHLTENYISHENTLVGRGLLAQEVLGFSLPFQPFPCSALARIQHKFFLYLSLSIAAEALRIEIRTASRLCPELLGNMKVAKAGQRRMI